MEGVSGLQRGERQLTWRWKSKCLANKCLLALQRLGETEWNLKKQTLIGPFLITHLVHAIVIYEDSSLPGTVQGRAQTFTPNLWGFDCFQLKIIPMPEILGGKFFSPILRGQTLHISPCTECKGGFSKYTWKSSEEWIKKI